MRRLIPVLFVIVYAAAAPAEVDKKAERNWKAKCASCHGAHGKGDTDQGKKMKLENLGSADVQKKSDTDLHDAIANGVTKNGNTMDGFKDKLDDASITALVSYVRTFKEGAKKAKKAKK